MSNKILILSAIVLAVVFSSCEREYLDEELSMKRTDYTGNELRIDGYYYRRYQFVDSKGVEQDDFIPCFLYRNGVSTYTYVYHYSEQEQAEEEFKNEGYPELMKNDRFRWRIFRIQGNTIEFEGQDYYSRAASAECVGFKKFGEIIDDTTFMITKEIVGGKVNEYAKGAVFRFKQFSPKPDSTNRFIK